MGLLLKSFDKEIALVEWLEHNGRWVTMSFLKRMFGNKETPISKEGPFRSLLQGYVASLPPISVRNDHNKCLSVLGSALNFGCEEKPAVSALSKYTSDTCLFELACYILASADFWTFNKRPGKRRQIQEILFSQLDAIASRSGFLPEQAAYRYANSRVGVYGEISAVSIGIEGQHLRLKQALVFASNQSEPPVELHAVTFGDAVEDLVLTRALVNWDMRRLNEMNSTLSEIE